MGVSRGTTPTVILQFDEESVDLTTAKNVYVTFKSNLKTITKSGDDLDVEPHSISVHLTQADTLSFQLSSSTIYDYNNEGVEVQANWTYEGGYRACSTIALLDVGRNLLMSEVE